MQYDTPWYVSLKQYRPFNERALWALFGVLGLPETYLDMGCGDAWMVRVARRAGVKSSIGVEVSNDARKYARKYACVLVRDLGGEINLGRKFDLVTSIEVGEHLPEDSADTFVHNLVRHTGKQLVFTAAAIGQGGDGHINCQPQEYWRSKIVDAGLSYNEKFTDVLRDVWVHTTGPMFWLPQNVQVFTR